MTIQSPPIGVAGRTKPPTSTFAKQRAFTKAAPYVLIAPFLVLFVVFFIFPIVYAGYLSLFVDRMIGGQVFVGIENYVRVLQDSKFLDGVVRVVTYGLIQVPVMLLLSLVLALLLDRERLRGRVIFQLGYFLPYAIPSVVSALIWGYMYGGSFGVFTRIAEFFGLPDPDLLSPQRILFSIGNIAVWAAAGANMVILYSALKSIPQELYEAARLDGANEWSIAWHIKIPLLRSTMTFAAILSIIAAMQLFNEPKVLQPNALGAISDSFTPNMYAYTLISQAQQYNLAAAVAFTLTAGIVALTAIFLIATRKRSR